MKWTATWNDLDVRNDHHLSAKYGPGSNLLERKYLPQLWSGSQSTGNLRERAWGQMSSDWLAQPARLHNTNIVSGTTLRLCASSWVWKSGHQTFLCSLESRRILAYHLTISCALEHRLVLVIYMIIHFFFFWKTKSIYLECWRLIEKHFLCPRHFMVMLLSVHECVRPSVHPMQLTLHHWNLKWNLTTMLWIHCYIFRSKLLALVSRLQARGIHHTVTSTNVLLTEISLNLWLCI